jgi:hypothetical protein
MAPDLFGHLRVSLGDPGNQTNLCSRIPGAGFRGDLGHHFPATALPPAVGRPEVGRRALALAGVEQQSAGQVFLQELVGEA